MSSTFNIGSEGLARRDAAMGTGIWLLMFVATALFSLFIAAYLMRMDTPDWSAIGMPWQLWLSTTLLIAGSVALQQAAISARRSDWEGARVMFLAGGACALAFLAAQLWAWQVLLAMRVMPVGNPAGSFFYLLTTIHGLHVAGGLAGWSVTARLVWSEDRGRDPAHIARFIALCARYWHFLLLVWGVLFATMSGLTPELVRFICGTP
ncbi:MAG: cytochrome c oxidase subunit [Burkholderiales bacterium]|jgi:cytochrome c oxidase subunit 3